MTENKKLHNLSFIKTLTMIIIILYHSSVFYTGEWFKILTPTYSSIILKLFSKLLNTFGVQTFIMISGFLFFYSKKYTANLEEKKTNIIKRFKRLIIPYISTSIFWVIPIYIMFYGFHLKEIIKNYILMESPSQLWFLIALFGIFILYQQFANKIKFSKKELLIAYVLTSIGGLTLSYFSINYFQISNIVTYSIYYYLGGYIYFNMKNITKRNIKFIITICFMLLLLFLFLNNTNINILHYLLLLIKPLLSLCEVTLIYYFCTSFINKYNNILDNKVYKLLEKNSFGIYLFHQQIIYFIIYFLEGLIHPIIQVILSFVFSLIISLSMSCILKRNKITKRMFGL